MDEPLDCSDRVLSLKRWGNCKNYCAFAVKMYRCQKYWKSTLCLVAFSHSLRNKNFAKWFVLIYADLIDLNDSLTISSVFVKSRIVFFYEFQVLIERNEATMIGINFIEVPLNHFFCNGNIQWPKRIFHQSSELNDINLLLFFGRSSSRSKEMCKLNKSKLTYS